MGVHVKAKPLPKEKVDALSLFAELCYHYPQYRMIDRRRLPHKHVLLLLKTARKIEAQRMYNLTNIVAAPHTKKGSGVKQLLSHFREAMNG